MAMVREEEEEEKERGGGSGEEIEGIKGWLREGWEETEGVRKCWEEKEKEENKWRKWERYFTVACSKKALL